MRLADVGTWRSGGTPPKDRDDLWGGGFPWISTRDLKKPELSGSTETITEDAAKRFSTTVPEGSILIGTRGMALAKRLPVAMVTRAVAFNQDIKAIVPDYGVSSKYLLYALLAFEDPILALTDEAAHGTKRLDTDLLRAFRIPCPGLADQARIAGFLDAETARLDALVVAKHRQRELAHERFRSWRNGLFASIANQRPLGLTVRVVRGTTFPDRYQGNTSGELPFVKVSDFSRAGNETVIWDASHWITSSVADELKATIIPKDAVIFPRVGMAMMSNPRRIAGRSIVMDDNQLALVLTHPGVPRYLLHWISTVDLVAQSNPGAVPSVTDASLKRLRIAWPPADEQRRIADVLDREARRVSTLDAAFGRSIALLRERREALITAAVTGRLQVPDTTRASAAA